MLVAEEPKVRDITNLEQNILNTMQQPDLFPEETALAKAEREAKEQEASARKKPRGVYHDRCGKFTDRATAEKASLEKENFRLKKNYNYYKRVNHRLSSEVKEANERADKWERLYKELILTAIDV